MLTLSYTYIIAHFNKKVNAFPRFYQKMQLFSAKYKLDLLALTPNRDDFGIGSAKIGVFFVRSTPISKIKAVEVVFSRAEARLLASEARKMPHPRLLIRNHGARDWT